MADYTSLLTGAKTIRDETQISANTANRVGSQLVKMVEAISEVRGAIGRISATSRDVRVTFSTPLTSGASIKPEIKVYRMRQSGTRFLREDVLHTFPSATWFNNTGFSLIIDEIEPLSGIIIEYEFKTI